MTTLNAKQLLSNLYGLMMEINYHRADSEVWEELQLRPDSQVDLHLVKIKQLKAKLRAQQNISSYQKIKEYIGKLKETGIDELEKLIPFKERAQLVPLFRKFEELTAEDEASIQEDQELLYLLELLKNKLDDNPK